MAAYNSPDTQTQTPSPATPKLHKHSSSGAGLANSKSSAHYADPLNESGLSTGAPSVTSSQNSTKDPKDPKEPKEFKPPKENAPELGIHYIVHEMKLFLECWSHAWLFQAYSTNLHAEVPQLIAESKLLPLGRCHRMTLDPIVQINECLLKTDISRAQNFIGFKVNPLAKTGSKVRLTSIVPLKRQQLFSKVIVGHLMELEGNILTIIFHHSKAEVVAVLDYDSAVEFYGDEKPYNRVESFGRVIESLYRNNKLIRYLINHCYGNPEYYKQDTLDGMGKQLENYLEDPVYKLAQGLAEKGAAYSNVKHSYPAIAGLDPSQLKAFMGAYSAANYYIVQGAPGTGKTKVIKALLSAYSMKKKYVLVVSQHNISLDKIIAEMDAEGLLSPQTAAFYGSPTNTLNLKYFIPEFTEVHHKISSLQKREFRLKALHRVFQDKKIIFANVADAMTEIFEIWVSGYNDTNFREKFDAVIVENAGNLPLLQNLLLGALGRKLVLVGDFNQPMSVYNSDIDKFRLLEHKNSNGATKKLKGTSTRSLLSAVACRFDFNAPITKLLLKRKNISVEGGPRITHPSHVAALLVNFV